MKPEIEAKFLDVNHDKIREVLKSKGAKLVQERQLMKRKNFDFPGRKLQEIGGWVRVRDEGNKITLAYKQLDHRGVDGTKEVYVVVNSFDDTCLLLESISLECTSYQETKRESWMLGDVEIELDEWPWIKPFIEIEAHDEDKLREVSKILGLNFKKAVHGSVEIAYQAEYDVTELDVDSWKEITFINVPDWLEEKRKK